MLERTLSISNEAPLACALVITKVGLGFGFFALAIAYSRILRQAHSDREVNILLLVARLRFPPDATKLLHPKESSPSRSVAEMCELLRSRERWSAELLETHHSYPVLIYFRSHLGELSWLAALTMIMDASAVIISSNDSAPAWQAQQTFSMALQSWWIWLSRST